jgi:hypothetical protein
MSVSSSSLHSSLSQFAAYQSVLNARRSSLGSSSGLPPLPSASLPPATSPPVRRDTATSSSPSPSPSASDSALLANLLSSARIRTSQLQELDEKYKQTQGKLDEANRNIQIQQELLNYQPSNSFSLPFHPFSALSREIEIEGARKFMMEIIQETNEKKK